MTAAHYFVRADDGHEITVHHWDPAGAPRAVLLIVHGMAEHAERYAPLAEYFAARGMVVHALDHRGHGMSAASAGDIGHFADQNGWQRVINDLQAVVTQLRATYPHLPLILLGHSMGSFIAQAWAIEHGAALAALVLSGSNYGSTAAYHAGRLIAQLEKFRIGARGKSALLEFLSFGAFNHAFKPARTAYDWLSRDHAQVDLYVDDPLCGFRVSTGLWIDLLGGLIDISKIGNLARIPSKLPVYILGGGRDPVGHAGTGLPRLAAKLREAGLRNVSLKLYAEGRHEMFNETNRHEVFADLAAWLDTVLSG